MPRKEHISREEDERLMALSIAPLIPVWIFTIAYLTLTKVISSFEATVQYTIILATIILSLGFGIYEAASSFIVKRPASFRAKRFASRAGFVSAYFLGFYALWELYTLSLSSFLMKEHIVILTLLTVSSLAAVLVSHPRTRPLIKKLTQEDSQ